MCMLFALPEQCALEAAPSPAHARFLAPNSMTQLSVATCKMMPCSNLEAHIASALHTTPCLTAADTAYGESAG